MIRLRNCIFGFFSMKKLKKILSKNKYVAVKLKKTATNHLEIKGRINKVQGRFILDTGASNSCVGIDLKDFFNLEAEVSETKAAGAGAIGMETHESKNNTLVLGDWKMKKFNLVLFDLSHVNSALEQHEVSKVDGIIGADVLEKGRAIIDYNKKLLYLKKAKK